MEGQNYCPRVDDERPPMNLISIIVPCYNYGWILHETLDSLIAQTHQQWECLIVDDGSTDETGDVARNYAARDNRFRYLHQKNQGVSAARNLGLQQATGDFIQLLDGDDLLAPQKLATQLDFLLAHPEVDIIYGDVRYFMHGNPEVLSRSFDMLDQPWIIAMHGRGLTLIDLFIERNRMVINAPLLRATLLQRVGLFDPSLRSMEDWEFWVRCAAADAYFHYDARPETWSFVRVHATSLSQNKPRMMSFMGRVRKQMQKLLLEIGAERAAALNRTELNAIREYNAVYNIQHGKIGVGLKLFWQTAHATGRYGYYLRSMLYWLRKREPQTGN